MELWIDIETHDIHAIAKRKNDYVWGAFYNIDKGYWGFGHYDYKSLVQARFNLFSMYGHQLDLLSKFDE